MMTVVKNRLAMPQSTSLYLTKSKLNRTHFMMSFAITLTLNLHCCNSLRRHFLHLARCYSGGTSQHFPGALRKKGFQVGYRDRIHPIVELPRLKLCDRIGSYLTINTNRNIFTAIQIHISRIVDQTFSRTLR